MATSRQEAQWVLRAQCDDREALELLLRSVQPALHRYLLGLVGASSADDVMQEVFIILCHKLAWLDAPELFRPWAYRIASRVAFRHLKKERRWSEQVRDESVLEELATPVLPSPARTFTRLAELPRDFAGQPCSSGLTFSRGVVFAGSSRNSGNSVGHGQIASRIRFGSPPQET